MTTRQQAAKRRGSQFETDVVKYVRSLGFPAERLRLAGRADEGDVAVQDVGTVYLLELKATRALDLSGWVRESEVEAANYAKARGLDPDTVWPLAVWKRTGKPIGQALVITTLDALLG